MKNDFYFILKAFLLSSYLNFCLELFIMQKKWPDQKYKVNFKIYDVTTWLTLQYTYCLISHKVKATRQRNLVRQQNITRKIFFFKNMQKMRQNQFQIFFFLKNDFYVVNNKSKMYKTLHYSSRDMPNFDFLEKSLGIVFPPNFVYDV